MSRTYRAGVVERSPRPSGGGPPRRRCRSAATAGRRLRACLRQDRQPPSGEAVDDRATVRGAAAHQDHSIGSTRQIATALRPFSRRLLSSLAGSAKAPRGRSRTFQGVRPRATMRLSPRGQVRRRHSDGEGECPVAHGALASSDENASAAKARTAPRRACRVQGAVSPCALLRRGRELRSRRRDRRRDEAPQASAISPERPGRARRCGPVPRDKKRSATIPIRRVGLCTRSGRNTQPNRASCWS